MQRHHEGIQLTLDRAVDERIARERLQLWRERDILTTRLVREGLSPVTAAGYVRHVMAMVGESDEPTISALLKRPDKVVVAIRMKGRARTRQVRHLTIQEAARLLARELGEGVHAELRQTLEASFPGRSMPSANLVDRSLGGSKKKSRGRPPVHLGVLNALIESAGQAKSGCRDASLIAMHVLTTLKPGEIQALTWERVLSLLVTVDEVALFDMPGRGPVAVGAGAVARLRAYWLSRAEPRTGPVFTGLGRSRRVLSTVRLSEIVREACERCGIPPVDRRHLRACFAAWLLDRGWDEKLVATACGYQRAGALFDLVGPVRESQKARESREFLLDVRPLRGSDGALRSPASTPPSLQTADERVLQPRRPGGVRDDAS